MNRPPCAGAEPRPARQSLALTVYDPDAPSGSGWWHWMVIDLPANTTRLQPNAGTAGSTTLPTGARQIRNDYGSFAWAASARRRATNRTATRSPSMPCRCPKLDIPDDATAALAGFMINANASRRPAYHRTYGR